MHAFASGAAYWIRNQVIGGICMSVKRVTFAPSALSHGPRPTEREIYRRDPPAVGQGRPAILPQGGAQHG